MKFFDLDITTSLGNDLSNVAQSKVNLQKEKKTLSCPHIIALLQASLIINQVLWYKEKFINNFRIVSQGTLKGYKGREFDTLVLEHDALILKNDL